MSKHDSWSGWEFGCDLRLQRGRETAYEQDGVTTEKHHIMIL